MGQLFISGAEQSGDEFYFIYRKQNVSIHPEVMLVEVSLLFTENRGGLSNIQTDAGRVFHSSCVKDQTFVSAPSLRGGVHAELGQGTSRPRVLGGSGGGGRSTTPTQSLSWAVSRGP